MVDGMVGLKAKRTAVWMAPPTAALLAALKVGGMALWTAARMAEQWADERAVGSVCN
jgi:hypothetical protein